MRVEKRNGKYYLILTDGEIELSKDELRKHYNFSRYLEKGLQYAKGENWTLGNLPEEFHSIIGIDIFIEDVKRFIKEKASQPKNLKVLKEVIDKLSRVVNSNIKNPLMAKHKKSYEYLMAQLADVKGDLLSVEKSSALQSPQQTTNENDTIRYTAKHYVLAYLIECNAKGESFPIGQKKELERIGDQRIGKGKGNRFYKVFNEIVNQDLNAEKTLIEVGGENWRTIVKDLSNEPEEIEKYLQNKRL
jgi:hypothetical protein